MSKRMYVVMEVEERAAGMAGFVYPLGSDLRDECIKKYRVIYADSMQIENWKDSGTGNPSNKIWLLGVSPSIDQGDEWEKDFPLDQWRPEIRKKFIDWLRRMPSKRRG